MKALGNGTPQDVIPCTSIACAGCGSATAINAVSVLNPSGVFYSYSDLSGESSMSCSAELQNWAVESSFETSQKAVWVAQCGACFPMDKAALDPSKPLRNLVPQCQTNRYQGIGHLKRCWSQGNCGNADTLMDLTHGSVARLLLAILTSPSQHLSCTFHPKHLYSHPQ